MGRRVNFTQAQVRRAVAAAESSGLKVRGVRFLQDGQIVVETGETEPEVSGQVKVELAGSWDDFR